jgi:lipopolysaccharide/colanic/teichoic acid biosynthesis glycosyltransferase
VKKRTHEKSHRARRTGYRHPPSTLSVQPVPRLESAGLAVGHDLLIFPDSPSSYFGKNVGPVYFISKRILDIAGSLIAIALLAAPALIISVMIKLFCGPGPVLFRQRRTGKGGKCFDLFKFRTMVQDADQLKERLRHLSVLPPPDFKIPDDPRVTGFGRFLRRTSLDELPNFLNVLRGDMSLVGPRPTSFGVDRYQEWHIQRLLAVPGITGLWQISGRSDIDFNDRVHLDLLYIQRRSFSYDLKILARTFPAVLFTRGAY